MCKHCWENDREEAQNCFGEYGIGTFENGPGYEEYRLALEKDWEIQMKYFEIKYPYYALIKAKNKEEAIKNYTETIADDLEGNLIDEINELDKDAALGKYIARCDSDTSIKQALEEFDIEDILLIDADLI